TENTLQDIHFSIII
ncbi:DUF5951 family protein, partial [Klebsiella pneumoniae]